MDKAPQADTLLRLQENLFELDGACPPSGGGLPTCSSTQPPPCVMYRTEPGHEGNPNPSRAEGFASTIYCAKFDTLTWRQHTTR